MSALSYLDDRFAFRIVVYDAQKNILKDFNADGDRYIKDISLNLGIVPKVATFEGESGASAAIPFTDFESRNIGFFDIFVLFGAHSISNKQSNSNSNKIAFDPTHERSHINSKHDSD